MTSGAAGMTQGGTLAWRSTICGAPGKPAMPSPPRPRLPALPSPRWARPRAPRITSRRPCNPPGGVGGRAPRRASPVHKPILRAPPMGRIRRPSGMETRPIPCSGGPVARSTVSRIPEHERRRLSDDHLRLDLCLLRSRPRPRGLSGRAMNVEEFARHQDSLAGAADAALRESRPEIRRRVEAAAAHARNVLTETLRNAPEGRPTMARVRASRSYVAALDDLASLV